MALWREMHKILNGEVLPVLRVAANQIPGGRGLCKQCNKKSGEDTTIRRAGVLKHNRALFAKEYEWHLI